MTRFSSTSIIAYLKMFLAFVKRGAMLKRDRGNKGSLVFHRYRTSVTVEMLPFLQNDLSRKV